VIQMHAQVWEPWIRVTQVANNRHWTRIWGNPQILHWAHVFIADSFLHNSLLWYQ
jgi:hypothetical protein